MLYYIYKTYHWPVPDFDVRTVRWQVLFIRQMKLELSGEAIGWNDDLDWKYRSK